MIGIDLLPIDPVPGVAILQGDFREDEALQALEAALERLFPRSASSASPSVLTSVNSTPEGLSSFGNA